MAGEMVVIIREFIGGACKVEARYYEDDGGGRHLVSTLETLVDSEDLLGFDAVVSAVRRTFDR